jgi:4-carboxymuconolactone decarboxylase
MTRYRPIQTSELSPEQRRVHDAIVAGPRKEVTKPLQVWLRVPEFAERAHTLGEYCRYRTSLGSRLSELAILVVAAYWRAEFEWQAHVPLARQADLSQEVIDAIGNDDAPRSSRLDERVVWRFCRDLLNDRRVSQDVWDDTVGCVAIEGVVDLIGILGYYSLIAMTINVFEL